MNILFRLFIFLGSVVVIALFAALIAPYFIDWDEFTAEFEAQASRVIGQEVKVGGKTNLRLLPLPFLSFEDLQVGNNADGSPLMTVERFSFNAELLPFLSGEVRIVEMSMRKPRVNLQVAEDGTIPWTSPKERIVNPEQVNIEKLNIESGSIRVTGLVGKRSLQLENIQGNVNAKSILGPWRINAEAEIEGVASQLKIATGTFQDDGSLRLKMEVNRKDQPYNLLLDGPVKLQNNALAWNGEFRVSPFSKLQVSEMIGSHEPLPVFSTGNFLATPKQVDIGEYRLDIGSRDDPYTITGQGVINLREKIYFKMLADGRQIDVDQLQKTSNEQDKSNLENRLSALHAILKRVPVPTAKGEIDVVLPAIVAGDTFIRDVKARISPTGKGWILRNLNATLPGNTAFEAQGRLGLQNGFGFSGKLVIASRQPSGFADWVSGNVDESFRQLKSVGLSSDILISPRQTTLENVELRLDDALLRGKLQRLSSKGGRPAILVELKGNRVNVDDLSAIYSLTQNSDGEEAIHDLNIKVKADVFEAMVADRPFVANGVDAHVQINQGTVSIERLNAQNVLGANIATVGRIENILVKPNGNMKLDISAKDATQLLAFSNQFFGGNSFIRRLQSRSDLTKDTRLNMELDTTENAKGARGRVLVNGEMGGSDISMQLGFDGSLEDLTLLPLTIDGSLKNRAPSILLQQMGVATVATELSEEIDGTLKLDFGFAGAAKSGFNTRLSMVGNDATLAATGKIVTSNWNDYDADLAVTLGAKDIAPYVRLVDVLLPGVVLNATMPVSASFQLNKTKSDFKFDALKGQLSGNQFSGQLALKQEQVLRPRINGQLAFSRADLPIITEAVFGRTTKLGNSLGIGDLISLEANSIFGEPLFEGLDANISVTSDKLHLGNQYTGDSAKFQIAMLDGAIDINALSFGFLGGEIEGGLRLKNNKGSVLANLNYSMLGMDAKQFTNAFGLTDFISGALTLNGSAEATGQSFDNLISNLSGNGFLALKEGEVSGLDVNALEGILQATDVDNYEITSDKIQTLFAKNIFGSGFKVAEFDTPFSINRGKIRARNVGYTSGETSLKSEVEYDLLNSILAASTVVELTPEKSDQISGADPQATISWKGALSSLERSINTDRLEGYLSLRAFEISQRRLETLEAQVMEKQRLRDQIAYNFVKEQHDERLRLEALRLEEERKLIEAEEAKRVEEERLKREAEAAEKERLRKIAEAEKRKEEARLAKLKAEAEEAEALRKLQEQTPPDNSGNFIQNIEEFLNAN